VGGGNYLVIDGSDGLMLSAESASGKFPIKCIRTMHEIALEVERDGDYYNLSIEKEHQNVAETIAASACLSAKKVNATVIVCLSTTGRTAAMISGYRPRARIIAVTHLIETLNRLELVWGIQTLNIKPYDKAEEAMEQIESLLLAYGLVRKGDKVVLTLGLPVDKKSKTNSIRIFDVDEQIDILSEQKLPLRCRPI